MIFNKYKLIFFVTDGTAEARFFCFYSVAKHIVGNPCEALLRNTNVSGNTPLDLTGIVGLGFTFAITINIISYYSSGRIFNVNSVLETHGRQHAALPTGEDIRIKICWCRIS
jgi:hypothetical protein